MNALKKDVVLDKKIKNEKTILSVVIPCWNCSETIERLLDSLVAQVNPPKFEVIIQDDHSTDNFMEKVEKYKSKLDIKYFKNKDREVHCPGNTRMDGLSHVTTEWVTFADNDDMYEPNAFDEFYKCVMFNNEKNLVVSQFREYFPDEDAFGKEYVVKNNITWMHGKFYNINFLKEYGINFKENLLSHEDLFFNQSCFSIITAKGLSYSILQVFTYRWVFNPNSLSRSMFKDHEYYIDVYYDDFIAASVQPWRKLLTDYPDKKDYLFNRECYVLLYAYFYYQSLYLRNGLKHHKHNRDLLESFLNDIKDSYGKTTEDILDVIYNDPESYNKTRREAMG